MLNIFPETSYVKSDFLPSMREFSVAISKKSDVIGDILGHFLFSISPIEIGS